MNNPERNNDNFRIERSDGLAYYMEHNQQEAKMVRNWLNGQQGGGWRIQQVPKDVVRRAKAVRPSPARIPNRLQVLRDMNFMA